jgi:DNA-binding XRE family transcriptional regulator
MTALALIKRVMDTYPEAFEDLSRPQLKLVKEAIVYAGKIGIDDEILGSEEHRRLLVSLTGKEKLLPSDRLKAYRARFDWTQALLAKKTGISQSNIAAMESGKRPIGLIMAKKLAKVLKCDYRRLI